MTAPIPPMVDNTGDDLEFFLKHPALIERVRLPIAGELPPEVWQAAVAAGLAGFVIVTRGAPGAPWIRSRQFVFAAGGTA
jgi:hypothetical protein